MASFSLAALLLLVSAVSNAQNVGVDWFNSLTCKYVASRDCFNYGDHPECGTNGITYRNRCDFSKAHCKDRDIHVLSYSPCASVTSPPTSYPGQTVAPVSSGENAVLDLICIEISHDQCAPDHDPVCGNDLKTYDNACEWQKAKCTHRELHVLQFGACP